MPIVDHQLRKASLMFEGKELGKHSAVKSCQAGVYVSGEGEWNRVNLHEACMSVEVYLHAGTHTLGCTSNFFFFVRKPGRGGDSKENLPENGLKKTSKITDDPLASHVWQMSGQMRKKGF